MTVKFNSYSMWIEKKDDDDWYDWCVFVDESSNIINSIKSVEYTLHPTFPDPIRLIESKSSKFALFSSGWGGFFIKTRVNYEDGSASTASYSLRLERDNWPQKQAPNTFADADNETKLVYQALFHRKHRWRKVDTVVKNSNLSNDTVLRILHNLEDIDLVRKAPSLSIDGKEMWGRTDTVGISPKISLS
jgi:transcription initiation factor IIF auxiliary subunit